MIHWPRALVGELAARRCIPFLGSGASAGSLSADGTIQPPDWARLLNELRRRFPDPQDAPLLDTLVDQQKFLDAAEVILRKIPSADFAEFIRDLLVTPRFGQSAIHEAVLSLDPKTLITTNWDDIYDRYCQTGDAYAGYSILRHYDDHIVSTLRSPVRLVVKAHGCVSNPSRVVFTRSQYFEARRQHPLFYKVLDSLFLTNTILFIGYSLSDPDIQLVLENATIASPSAHPHYAVLPSGSHPALQDALQRAYNIHVLEYPAGQYDEIEEGLRQLLEDVTAHRVRFRA